MTAFKESISAGIPNEIPQKKKYDLSINHAPKRKDILSTDEKKLALKNALRYFPKEQHTFLAEEFAHELNEYGRIYMYRYRHTHIFVYVYIYIYIIQRIVFPQ